MTSALSTSVLTTTTTNVFKRKQHAILFMGGSFNPVHRAHFEMMQFIRTHLQTHQNLQITRGYLVITTDGYVKSKLKLEAIKFKHRQRLIAIMSEDSNLHCHSSHHNQNNDCDDNDSVDNDEVNVCDNNSNTTETESGNSGVYSWIKPSESACGSAIQYLQTLKQENKYKYRNTLMINCMGSDKVMNRKGNVGKWRKYTKNYGHRQCLTVCVHRIPDDHDNENDQNTHNTHTNNHNHEHGNSGRTLMYNYYLSDLENGLVSSKAFLFINQNTNASTNANADIHTNTSTHQVSNISSTMVRAIVNEFIIARKQQQEQQQKHAILLSDNNNHSTENGQNLDLDLHALYLEKLQALMSVQCAEYILQNVMDLWIGIDLQVREKTHTTKRTMKKSQKKQKQKKTLRH